MKAWSQSMKAIGAGVVCLAVLAVMILLHAWPLWTGQVVTLPVTLSQSTDAFRGERLSIGPPGGRVVLGGLGTPSPVKDAIVVPPVGDWWSRVPSDSAGRRRAIVARIVYLQLERSADGRYRPASIAVEPIRDMLNLRGRVRAVGSTGVLDIDYGIDSYYMQEGQASQVEGALRAHGSVDMQVAIARSGRARIKSLLINGTPIT
jgi:hypothetical protein